jgi:hypothetical protein
MNDNLIHAARHARHALEDFQQLRHEPANEELWHSLSHHLRHAEYRLRKEGQPTKALPTDAR